MPSRDGDVEAKVTTREPRARRKLGLPAALVVAFVGIGIINAVAIEILVPWPRSGLVLRLEHHAFDFGQMLACGFIGAGAVLAWSWLKSRVAMRSEALLLLWGFSLLTILSVTLAFPLLDEDLMNITARLARERGTSILVMRAVVTSAVGLGVPFAAAAGHYLDRPYMRWVGVLLGAVMAEQNHLVLKNDYPGAHLYLMCAAGAVAGASLASLSVPRPSRALRIRIQVGLAVLAALSSAAMLIKPRPAIIVELLKTRGSAMAPILARASGGVEGAIAPVAAEQEPWFRNRTKEPAVPPTRKVVDAPIVFLLTIDAMRADILESKLHDDIIPNLASIRGESVHFTQARSPGSQTVYTLSGIFTGKYFSELYWTPKAEGGMWPYKDDSIRFTQLLTKVGIPTVHISSCWWFMPGWGLTRGFSEEWLLRPTREHGNYATGIEMADAIRKRLARHQEGPLFLFAHLMDAHAPYTAGAAEGPDPYRKYLASLAYVDVQVGRLRKALDEHPLADRVIWIIGADHGEAFGDHGTFEHGVSVYEELLRVPLMVRGRALTPHEVTAPVSMIDLGPTILDLFQQPTPGVFLGQSLVPILRGEAPALTRPIVAEDRLKQTILFADGIKAIRDLHNGGEEIFDLGKDPKEADNLVDDSSVDPERRLATVGRFFDAHTLRRPGYKPPYRP